MPLTSEVFSRMVGRVVAVTRENCVMPRYVNMDYAAELSSRGNTINVPLTSPASVRDITPNVVPPATGEPSPTTVPVSLDFWKESAFVLSDRDLSGLDDPNSWINRQLEECGRAVANNVNSSLLDLYLDIPHRAGVAGTTPFASSTLALQEAERVLLTNLAPPGRRALILDPFAHANALGLSAFQNALAFGGTDVIREGRVTRALGYDWDLDQQMRFHTRGTASGTPLTNGVPTATPPVNAAGSTSVVSDGWTANVTNILRRGDIITIAGDANPYVVTANVNSDGSGNATIPISRGFAQSTGLWFNAANDSAITVTASHRVSLALHPDFAAFASRIADDLTGVPAAGLQTRWADPISGLALLVRVTPQYYQSMFSVSCLWGCRLIRPEFACRVMG